MPTKPDESEKKPATNTEQAKVPVPDDRGEQAVERAAREGRAAERERRERDGGE